MIHQDAFVSADKKKCYYSCQIHDEFISKTGSHDCVSSCPNGVDKNGVCDTQNKVQSDAAMGVFIAAGLVVLGVTCVVAIFLIWSRNRKMQVVYQKI